MSDKTLDAIDKLLHYPHFETITIITTDIDVIEPFSRYYSRLSDRVLINYINTY